MELFQCLPVAAGCLEARSLGAVHAVMGAGRHYLAFICIVYQLFKCQAFL